MSKESNVVKLIRRHLKVLEDCPLFHVNEAMANLEVVGEAAKRSGLEELAQATMDHDILSTQEGREMVFNHLEDPTDYLDKATNRIDKFKKFLQ